jgi:site-specific recombinase XerD
MVDTENNEEEPETRKYLDAQQAGKYLGVVTDLDHIVILRLLMNGLYLKDILKIRPKDVKYRLCQIKLVSPGRKVSIDRPTTNLIEQYMAKHQFWTKDTCRLFGTDTCEDYTARSVRHFVSEYGLIANMPFPISCKVLQNTYYTMILATDPEITVEEIHAHMGHVKLSYTSELVEYYKKELERIKKG